MAKTRGTRQAMQSYNAERRKSLLNPAKRNDSRTEEELWEDNASAIARILAKQEEQNKENTNIAHRGLEEHVIESLEKRGY